MSWKVWKDPLERATEEFQKGYAKGLNLADWNTAYSCFNSACGLFNEAGDGAKANLSRALCLFCWALINPQKAENWGSAGAGLNYTGLAMINITSNIATQDLVQECKIKELELKSFSISDGLARAAQLEETAKQYLVFGSRSLLVPLLLEKQQITGVSRGHTLIAEAAIIRGQAELAADPKHASEFFRMAAMHMKTAGVLPYSQTLLQQAEDYATTAACYFCGREVVGKEINFVYMKARLTKYIEEQGSTKALPSSSKGMVVACKGCHSAITMAADDIAKAYFDQVQVQIQRLQDEINHLQARINSVNARAR